VRGPAAGSLRQVLVELEGISSRIRQAVAQGRLTELTGLAQRHRDLLGSLSQLRDSESAPWPDSVQHLVESIREEGRRSLTLLLSVREELQRTVEDGRSRRQASTRYRQAGRSGR
jgi:hypothetical protein